MPHMYVHVWTYLLNNVVVYEFISDFNSAGDVTQGGAYTYFVVFHGSSFSCVMFDGEINEY